MKKKSPPYAIIGAVVLGIVAIILFVQHEKSAKAAADAAILKAQQDAAAAAAAAAAAVKPAGPTINEVDTSKMRKVLYATQPIAPGVRISPSFFEVKLTPAEILPDAYTDGQDLVGWYATRTIEKGDPLTPRNVGKTLPFLEGRIAPGMRAVAIPIFTGGAANATGGFVVDGDKVDLLMSRTPDGRNGKEIYDTQMVMQNLQVLYVPGPQIKTDETNGVNPVPGAAGAISVMFEVTPEQAQALINLSQAKEVSFSMILRSRRDDTEIKIKPFVGYDYYENPKKLQKTTDVSIQRVQDLQKQIEAEEAKNQGQGNTNATSTIPPAP